MVLKQKIQSEIFNSLATQWLDSVFKLIKESKETNVDDKTSKIEWANEWVVKTDQLDADLEELLNYYAKEEKEINSTENAPVIDHFINMLNVMNLITSNMFKILNQDCSERILATKECAENRYHLLLMQKEELVNELAYRKRKIRGQEIKNKLKEFHCNPEKIRKEMREKALMEHQNYLAKREAIKAINEVETQSIISNDSHVEYEQLEETPFTDRRKRRRSRSLARKVIGSVKKTVRRSVSALHHYMEHQHHHE